MAAVASEQVNTSPSKETPSPKEAPSGLPANQGDVSGLSSSVQSQAQQATNGMQGAQAEAAKADRGLYTDKPTQAPTMQEHTPSTASEQIQKQGQSLQDAGTKYEGPAQSQETKSNLQSALDKSSETSQNAPSEGSRLSAARQEAASAPAPAPSSSPSMSH